MSDETDFSNYPQSVTERRADVTPDQDNAGQVWTPRDVLIRMLREIDSGKINPETLVVCYAEADKQVSYKQASQSVYTTIGVMEACKGLMLK